jgi:hypothetical protein
MEIYILLSNGSTIFDVEGSYTRWSVGVYIMRLLFVLKVAMRFTLIAKKLADLYVLACSAL